MNIKSIPYLPLSFLVPNRCWEENSAWERNHPLRTCKLQKLISNKIKNENFIVSKLLTIFDTLTGFLSFHRL